MNVYAVINQSFYAGSSYYDVIEVCDTTKKAETIVETSVKDILENGLLGDNPKVYYDNDIPEDWNNTWGCLIHEKETGYYEHFRIEMREVK
jgi:hypothetical protein